MKALKVALLVLMSGGSACATVAAPTQAAAESGFCAGFKAGWAAVFQNRNMIVRITPICPIPPIGRDSFQGGYEMGMIAALQDLQRQPY